MMNSKSYWCSAVLTLIGAQLSWGQFPDLPSRPSMTDLATVIRQASHSQNQNGFTSPMIDAQISQSMAYDNRVKKARTYYERKLMTANMRDQLKQERLARMQRNGAARRERLEMTKRKKPDSLTSFQLDPVTGRIDWPVVLQADRYTKDRQIVDELYPAHMASGGGVNTYEYGSIQRCLKSIKLEASQNRKEMLTEQYTHARKFLESLIHETRYPSS